MGKPIFPTKEVRSLFIHVQNLLDHSGVGSGGGDYRDTGFMGPVYLEVHRYPTLFLKFPGCRIDNSVYSNVSIHVVGLVIQNRQT